MKKKYLMLIPLLLLVLTLTGCSSSEAGVLPIHSGGEWFDWILVKPVAWILNIIADGLSNSFAIGILFTTIIVRTIAWPIYAKTNDFSLKMQIMQPELARLQSKYAGKKDDPEAQQKMQAETMKIWKKYGVSPLGCLMPFLQMPIFIAMYQVVQRYPIPYVKDATTNTITHTSEFPIVYDSSMNTDALTSKPFSLNTTVFGLDMQKGVDFTNDGAVALLYMIIPILVGVTMFLLQYFSQKKPAYTKNLPVATPNAQAEQSQKMMKYMSYGMVLMMVVFSMQNTALAFYWLVGNIYSLGQSLLNRKLGAKKFAKLQEQSNIIG